MSFDKETLRKTIKETSFYSSLAWREPSRTHQFNGVRWRPDFVTDNTAICLITSSDIPSYVERRITAATQAGHSICCICDVRLLSNDSSVKLLSEVNASICYVDDKAIPHDIKPLLKILAEQEIPISPDTRKTLVKHGLDRCLTATSSNRKGKTLERLAHFMFGQIADFRVLRCNWRTATEELDCVIQIRSISQLRCWAGLAAPHIIVEAKNRQEKTGQETISKLLGIMGGKRGTCRIGIFVSISGFTSDARDQVLRTASDDKILVLLDQNDLLEWGTSDQYDDCLEKHVTKAMLY